jgi:hypothetical protein
MPFGKWQDFDACVSDFKAQGKDEDSAKKICGALQAKLGKESFSWIGDLESVKQTGEFKHYIRGKAIHPCKTVHPEEWPATRVYLEEELQKAAHTLVSTPLLLDHLSLLDGKVLGIQYEDGALEYVAGHNDNQIQKWIEDGTIKHCSVEYDWGNLTKLNGVAPKDITFQGLALLKDLMPGDPATNVEVWEALARRLKEAKNLSEQGNNEKNVPPTGKEQQDLTVDDLKQRIQLLEQQRQQLTNDKTALEEKIQNFEAEKSDLVKRLGEGVIDPLGKPKVPEGYIEKKTVLDLIEAVIPSRQIIFSHGQTGGFHRLVDDIIRVKCRIEEEKS